MDTRLVALQGRINQQNVQMLKMQDMVKAAVNLAADKEEELIAANAEREAIETEDAAALERCDLRCTVALR